MATLKWLLNASLMIAFMFLGMQAKPQKDDAEKQKSQKPAIIRIFG